MGLVSREELVARLESRPEITTVSGTTLFMHGWVDQVETFTGGVNLLVCRRYSRWEPKGSWVSTEQDFSVWLDWPDYCLELVNSDFLVVTRGSLILIHADSIPFFAWRPETCITDQFVRSRQVIQSFAAEMLANAEFSGVWLGVPTEVSIERSRINYMLSNVLFLKGDTLRREELPKFLLFERNDVVYNLGTGLHVLLRTGNAVFFLTEVPK